ncbi:MAG: hypothetical protein CL477_18200 [Acidobacteria bacterium]|nr:hypothetical protein [Acidobacteriota bacterium]
MQRRPLGRESSEYRGDTLDSADFIHCSDAEQLIGVANSKFKGHSDLLLTPRDSSPLPRCSPSGYVCRFARRRSRPYSHLDCHIVPRVSDHRGLFERGDARCVVANLFEHGVGVLAEHRRRRADTAGGVRQLDRYPQHLHRSGLGVGHRQHHHSFQKLRV